MKTKQLLALFLLCTILPSCANETPVSPQCDCSCDVLLSEFLATMPEPREEVTTVLWDGERAMIEDMEKYGEDIAREFYLWRHMGNPDIYEAEEYTSFYMKYDITGDYIHVTPLQKEYSLSDGSLDNFGIHIIGTHQRVQEELYAWSHFLNLEKNIGGDLWERCAILDENRIGDYGDLQSITKLLYDDKDRGPYEPSSHVQYLYMLNRNPILTIDTEQIYPELTPGEYRFIFYFFLEDPDTGVREYCKQHVYFNIVE